MFFLLPTPNLTPTPSAATPHLQCKYYSTRAATFTEQFSTCAVMCCKCAVNVLEMCWKCAGNVL